jgi:hypothetical protein
MGVEFLYVAPSHAVIDKPFNESMAGHGWVIHPPRHRYPDYRHTLVSSDMQGMHSTHPPGGQRSCEMMSCSTASRVSAGHPPHSRATLICILPVSPLSASSRPLDTA